MTDFDEDFELFERDRMPDFLEMRKKRAKKMSSAVPGETVVPVLTAKDPAWAEQIAIARKQMNSIRKLDAELEKLYKERSKVNFKHGFDDEHPLDNQIEATSGKIDKLIYQVETCIKKIALLDDAGQISKDNLTKLSNQEKYTRENAMKTITTELQNITKRFQKRQKDYLISMQATNKFVETFFPAGSLDIDQAFTSEQLAMLEEAELDVNRRTQQIARIAKAVNDIASAMHEMSVLIVDQGSILDRIDHNVESAIVDIKTGRDEVDSASKYQEKSTAAYTCQEFSSVSFLFQYNKIFIMTSCLFDDFQMLERDQTVFFQKQRFSNVHNCKTMNKAKVAKWIELAESSKTELNNIRKLESEVVKVHKELRKVNFHGDDKSHLVENIMISENDSIKKVKGNLDIIKSLMEKESSGQSVENGLNFDIFKSLLDNLSSDEKSQKNPGLVKVENIIIRNILAAYSNELDLCSRKFQSKVTNFGTECQEMDNWVQNKMVPGILIFDDDNEIFEAAKIRSERIASIAKLVTEMYDMMHALSSEIISQGDILNRIDYNVESAVASVKSGHTDIKLAQKHLQDQTRSTVACTLAGLVALAIGVLCIKI